MNAALHQCWVEVEDGDYSEPIGCMCSTGRDHDETEMDLPPGKQTHIERYAEHTEAFS